MPATRTTHITPLSSGLSHQFFFHFDCPGFDFHKNATVPCPDGSQATTKQVMGFFYITFSWAAWLLLPLAVALADLAPRLGRFGYEVVVCASNVLGVAMGVFCAVEFTPIPAVLSLMFLSSLVIIGAALQLVYASKRYLVAGRAYSIAACAAVIVGFVIQVGMTASCGSKAYRTDGAAGCAFGGDGITGLNHNFVYHVFEIASKLCFVIAARRLGADDAAATPPSQEIALTPQA